MGKEAPPADKEKLSRIGQNTLFGNLDVTAGFEGCQAGVTGEVTVQIST
jgi:hypothetical protein